MNQFINPYVAGNPVGGERGFFGRKEMLEWVAQELRNPSTNALIFFGQRRIGKTTLLLQLQRILPTELFLPVYFDLQGQATQQLGQVLADLADAVAARCGIRAPSPDEFDLYGHYFREDFLPDLYQSMSKNRRLVLLLDEFDALDQKARRELPDVAAAKALFPFLRRVMAEDAQIAFVFAIGRQIEDLSQDFNALFKAALHREIWVLDQESARSLVCQAEMNGTLQFTKQAVKRILSLTNGHPYLTQLICQRVWERAYRGGPVALPPRVDVEDVESSIPDALDVGQASLVWLWEGLSLDEKVYAAALAEVAQQESQAISENEVSRVLTTSAASQYARELALAPYDLVNKKVLEKSGRQEYRFAVELIRRWIRLYRPLQEVMRRLDRENLAAERSFDVGVKAFYRKEWKESLPYFRDALVANPNHLQARLYLGKALLESELFKNAVVELKKAYELDSTAGRSFLTQALVKYAEELKKSGDVEGALEKCEEALDLSPNDREAQQLWDELRTRPQSAAPKSGESEIIPVADQKVAEQEATHLQFLSPYIITITGASRAGKSTTIDYLLAYAHEGFEPRLVPKYSSRARRIDERDAEIACVENIPPECDLVYEQYGNRYGVELQMFIDYLAEGASPTVILNDVRAVEDVRRAFRGRVRSIFIFRHDPWSEEYQLELIESRGEAGQLRFEKAQMLYRVYIENIYLFDYVIVNTGTFDQLEMQVKQIVRDLI